MSRLEADVVRYSPGVPHCKVCRLFLNQAVPMMMTSHGLALFCETCEFGLNAVIVKAQDAAQLQFHLDPAPGSDEVAEEEE